MSDKFSFEEAKRLSESLNKVADMLMLQNKSIKQKYINLNESFKDQSYYEYKEKFSECDRSIFSACELLKEFSVEILAYAEALKEVK